MKEQILDGYLRVDYFMQHAFAGQPDYYTNFINSLQAADSTITYAAFFDEEKTQPAIILIKYR